MPSVGDVVGLTLTDGTRVRGKVKYFGLTEFAPGIEWVGVFLDTPNGKNDGSVQGKRYFTCPMSYGIFCKPHQLTVEAAGESLLRGISSMSDNGLMDTKPVCSIVKIKIAKTIELLNEDMQLAEKFEEPNNSKISQEEYEKLLTQLSEMAADGVNHLQTFKNDIDRLNSF